MTDDVLCGCSTTCRVAYGCCHCGCGGSTRIAPQTSTERGWVQGSPIRYIRGHASRERKDRHVLTEVDLRNRRAQCSRCGEVTIKADRTRTGGWACTRRVNTEHRLHEVDPDAMTAWCLGCQQQVRLAAGPGRLVCAVRKAASEAEYRAKSAPARAAYGREWNAQHGRANRILRIYGLTVEDYDALLESQGGVCASCAGPAKGPGASKGNFHVDHCHNSTVVRGLLCGSCNTALGLLGDTPEGVRRLLDYIERTHLELPSRVGLGG